MTLAVASRAAEELAIRVKEFVKVEIVPFENDPRVTSHGPTDELALQLQQRARQAGLLTPHIRPDGTHLTHRETALVLQAAGHSPIGPVALNVAAPDEGNMYLLGRIATPEQKSRFLGPLIEGRMRSAFFMTEPAAGGGAGSDPSMLKTTAERVGDLWVLNGTKAFITGAAGADVGIVVARTSQSATLFLVALPNPAIRVERVLDTLDNSMPGGHAIVQIEELRLSNEHMLGEVDQGFAYAQIRLAPARLTHCMRWLGAVLRCQQIATEYAAKRSAFGKLLIDHEGVGFMLADNAIDLKQCELMINWCADMLDSGATGTVESAMTKVAVSETLFRVVDRCIQVMGGTGVTGDTVVEWVFREIRAFRIYDGPTEVHKWSIAKKIKRDSFSGASQ